MNEMMRGSEYMKKQALEIIDTESEFKIKIADKEIPYITGYSLSHDLSCIVNLKLELSIPLNVVKIALDDCELK